MGRLEGKVAVITGAASGIGRAAAELFVSEGASVVAADISDTAAAGLERAAGGGLVYVHCDVTKEDDVSAAVRAAVDRFGRLDIMFNNAGGGGDPAGLLDLSADGLQSTLAFMTTAVMLGSKYAARQFIAQRSGGSIINTSSSAGIQPGWSGTAYTIAKHGVAGVTRQAAAELGAHGIRSNAIAPGVVSTPLAARAFGIPPEHTDEFNANLDSRLGGTIPLGRIGSPREIAEAALWLGSDASSYVTGVILPVDGGSTTVYGGNYVEGEIEVGAEWAARYRR